MTPDFKYFFWATPNKHQPLYALYDFFDNHFMLQSYDYQRLFTIRTLFRSKTTLEILNLSTVENLVEKNLLDYSVIEKWGADTTELDFYTDLQLGWSGHTQADAYHQRIVDKIIKIQETKINFDTFKKDLQQQLFFVHYCLEYNPSADVIAHLNTAIGLGVDCHDVINRFLDLTSISDKKRLYDLLNFLKISKLIYE